MKWLYQVVEVDTRSFRMDSHEDCSTDELMGSGCVVNEEEATIAYQSRVHGYSVIELWLTRWYASGC